MFEGECVWMCVYACVCVSQDEGDINMSSDQTKTAKKKVVRDVECVCIVLYVGVEIEVKEKWRKQGGEKRRCTGGAAAFL